MASRRLHPMVRTRSLRPPRTRSQSRADNHQPYLGTFGDHQCRLLNQRNALRVRSGIAGSQCDSCGWVRLPAESQFNAALEVHPTTQFDRTTGGKLRARIPRVYRWARRSLSENRGFRMPGRESLSACYASPIETFTSWEIDATKVSVS